MSTLIKSKKQWNKYKDLWISKITIPNVKIDCNEPKEYPFLVNSYISEWGFSYKIVNFFIYKDDVKDLL